MINNGGDMEGANKKKVKAAEKMEERESSKDLILPAGFKRSDLLNLWSMGSINEWSSENDSIVWGSCIRVL